MRSEGEEMNLLSEEKREAEAKHHILETRLEFLQTKHKAAIDVQNESFIKLEEYRNQLVELKRRLQV